MDVIIHNLSELIGYDPKSPLIFSSGVFWALFLIFLPIYALLKRSRIQMTLFVIAFSLYFYYKCSGWFFLLLIGTSIIDWNLSHILVRQTSRIKRRICMIASIALSLGVLCGFKYANFFLWNWNAMVGGNFQPFDVILPVGISFYTFQSISYVVDVYRGDVKPTQSWFDYIFFLSFFPALVAGPIVRADYFLPQLEQNRQPSTQEIYTGLWLVILGIIKKAIIADYIAQYNDLIFASPGAYSGFETLMGTIGYTMQIYCDFSGYSDMAIGIALIMGFRLMKNFDFPYKASNLTQFWRQWHISLSSWLRDYLYIPLGGNRKGTLRTYANNFVTMLLGGLWHGAGWKFIFWGGMHGLGLAVHKACRPWLKHLPDNLIVKIASWSLTITYVSLLWVFFRADSWTDSWIIIKTIFTDFDPAYIPHFIQARSTWCILMSIIILAHSVPRKWYEQASQLFVSSPWFIKLLLFVIIVQLVVQFMSEEVSPFIYFQF